jgi:mannose-6-phosphate isomerase-like protein (cupin superfamily)
MQRRPIVILVSIAALAAAAAAQAQGLDGARYISAKEIAARLAKPVNGTVNFALPTGPGVTVLAARRDTAGDVEVHTALNDQFIGQSGRATVRVGGQLSGAREVAPGEWRGGVITGGQTFNLAPGDALWIPAGQAHQVTPLGAEPFVYIAAKYPAKP